MMKSGTLVRHLILPGNTRNSIAVLHWLHDHLPENPVSLMSQYVPCGRAEEFPEINRTITRREYEKVRDVLFELELDGYMQGRSAAKKTLFALFSGRAGRNREGLGFFPGFIKKLQFVNLPPLRQRREKAIMNR